LSSFRNAAGERKGKIVGNVERGRLCPRKRQGAQDFRGKREILSGVGKGWSPFVFSSSVSIWKKEDEDSHLKKKKGACADFPLPLLSADWGEKREGMEEGTLVFFSHIVEKRKRKDLSS